MDSSDALPECPTCGKRTYSFLHSCPYRGSPHHWWLNFPASTEGTLMDSSDGLNVGDVTGPRWVGGTRNPGNDEAARAWDEHVAEMRRAHPWIKPSIPIAGRGDFIVGYRARDAEVKVLREQLAAAEAVIEKVREWCAAELAVPPDPEGYGRWHDEGFNNACERVLLLLDPDASLPAGSAREHKAYDRWLKAHDREIATRAADPVTGSFYVARLFRSGTEGSTDDES